MDNPAIAWRDESIAGSSPSSLGADEMDFAKRPICL